MANQQENEALKALSSTIALGIEVQEFLESSIGKFLSQRVEDDVESLVEELKVVDPENVKDVRKLQNAIAIREQVMYWLAEAIQTAHNAQRELEPID